MTESDKIFYKSNVKYITSNIIDGELLPMGMTKTFEQCRELAKLHKQVVCEIKIIEEPKW